MEQRVVAGRGGLGMADRQPDHVEAEHQEAGAAVVGRGDGAHAHPVHPEAQARQRGGQERGVGLDEVVDHRHVQGRQVGEHAVDALLEGHPGGRIHGQVAVDEQVLGVEGDDVLDGGSLGEVVGDQRQRQVGGHPAGDHARVDEGVQVAHDAGDVEDHLQALSVQHVHGHVLDPEPDVEVLGAAQEAGDGQRQAVDVLVEQVVAVGEQGVEHHLLEGGRRDLHHHLLAVVGLLQRLGVAGGGDDVLEGREVVHGGRQGGEHREGGEEGVGEPGRAPRRAARAAQQAPGEQAGHGEHQPPAGAGGR